MAHKGFSDGSTVGKKEYRPRSWRACSIVFHHPRNWLHHGALTMYFKTLKNHLLNHFITHQLNLSHTRHYSSLLQHQQDEEVACFPWRPNEDLWGSYLVEFAYYLTQSSWGRTSHPHLLQRKSCYRQYPLDHQSRKTNFGVHSGSTKVVLIANHTNQDAERLSILPRCPFTTASKRTSSRWLVHLIKLHSTDEEQIRAHDIRPMPPSGLGPFTSKWRIS